MNFRFLTVAMVVLLIAGGAALAVSVNDGEVAASSTQTDEKSDIESDLDAVLNDDEELAADEAVDDDGDDTGGTKGDDTNESKDTGGTGGSGSGDD